MNGTTSRHIIAQTGARWSKINNTSVTLRPSIIYRATVTTFRRNHHDVIHRRVKSTPATTIRMVSPSVSLSPPLLSVSASFQRHPVLQQQQQHQSLPLCRFLHTSSDSRQVMLEIEDNGLGTITLNRPNVANALGRVMLSEMNEVLDYLEKEASPKEVRCVILTSSSDRFFSAGADLKERATMSKQEAEDFVCSLRDTFHRVSRLPMPVLCAIEGAALGGGLELALATDYIFAASTALFGMPETTLGIIPGAGGTQRLSRKIGSIPLAMELIFTGKRIKGDQAHNRYKIVQTLTKVGRAEDAAAEMGNDICKSAPLAVRAAKEAIVRGIDAYNMDEALEIERECYQRTLPTKDRLEALAAFREKRSPVFFGE